MKKQKKSMQAHMKQEISSYLNYYMKKGIKLYIDDMPCSPEEIANAVCVSEECGYMADYVQDYKGEVIEIRYDKIKKCND